jgi:hypothetical protein
MNYLKHTPGPWYVIDSVEPPLPNSQGTAKWIGTYDIKTTQQPDENTLWVADIKPYECRGFTDKDTAFANARLIAAAPDLLEAAILAKKYFDSIGYGFNQEVTDAANALTRAINKATLPHPRYTHDCSACTYLGHHDEYDLYFDHIELTAVARFGDEGASYYSGINSSLEPLSEARQRAVDKGII